MEQTTKTTARRQSVYLLQDGRLSLLRAHFSYYEDMSHMVATVLQRYHDIMSVEKAVAYHLYSPDTLRTIARNHPTRSLALWYAAVDHYHQNGYLAEDSDPGDSAAVPDKRNATVVRLYLKKHLKAIMDQYVVLHGSATEAVITILERYKDLMAEHHNYLVALFTPSEHEFLLAVLPTTYDGRSRGPEHWLNDIRKVIGLSNLESGAALTLESKLRSLDLNQMYALLDYLDHEFYHFLNNSPVGSRGHNQTT